MLHRRLAVILLRRCGLGATNALTADDLPGLVSTLKDFTLRVTGTPTAQQAQVMRGGLATEGFDPQTLESLEQPGIHAAGEALAIDAPCGGYNLHWAWASALVAGKAAAGAEGARET
jgi:predicted flavoprotein YhiN